MSTRRTCQPEVLLNTDACEILYCSDCDMIYLSMGSMTLRISTEHYQALSQDLSRGLRRLQNRNKSTAQTYSDNVTPLHH